MSRNDEQMETFQRARAEVMAALAKGDREALLSIAGAGTFGAGVLLGGGYPVAAGTLAALLERAIGGPGLDWPWEAGPPGD